MRIEASFTFAVEVDVEDRNDASEIARKARPLIIDRINSDSIAECLEDTILLDEEEIDDHQQFMPPDIDLI